MREHILAQFGRFEWTMGVHPKDKVLPINNHKFKEVTWDTIALLNDEELLKLVCWFARLYKVEF